MSVVISDDEFVFVRQRRNVMFASVVPFVVWILQLQYRDTKFFDVKVLASDRTDILWAILILYFLWRMYQCMEGGGYQTIPGSMILTYVLEWWRLNESSISESIGATVKEDREKILPYPEAQVAKVIYQGYTWEGTYGQGAYTFNLRFDVSISDSRIGDSQTSEQRKYVLPIESKPVRRAKFKAYVAACWRKNYFSEYLLPYVLGFSAIALCGVNHVWPTLL